MKSKQGWAELYAFEVDRALDAPVFRQIYLQLRSAILRGTLRPATKLPSTRELATRLGVSRPTVVSAFEQLLAEGYTFGKKGAGTYIASNLPEPFVATHRRNKRPVSAAKTAASRRDLSGFVDVTAQSDERPFNLGRTLVDARTAELWRKLSARTLRSFGRHHLGYGDPHGMLELRKSVCEYLRAARAVQCEPEQVVITAGTQQAIDIVAASSRGRTRRSGSKIRIPLTCLALVCAAPASAPYRSTNMASTSPRHPSRAESACRFHNALAPVSERRRPVDGAPPRTSGVGARVGRVDRRG